MKTSNVKFQDRKKNSGRIWGFFFRYFGKSFWIMTMLCVSCSANTPTSVMLPVTGVEAEANIIFSPDQVDFGNQTLNSTSSAQKVIIRNNESIPMLINHLSVTAGFSIVANTCPKPPNAVPSQGTCIVEIVFKPNLPNDWVGELQVHYDPDQVVTLPLMGFARPEHLMASIAR